MKRHERWRISGTSSLRRTLPRWNITISEPQGSLSRLKTPLAGGDPSRRHRQIGAANLSNDNAGVLRWARWEQKSHVQQTLEQRVKAHLILIFRMNTNRESVAFQSAWVLSKRYQKSYYKYNWLVPAKRSHRFLILRCRLFLSLRSRIPQVMDCSPTNRELQLGFDRRETG